MIRNRFRVRFLSLLTILTTAMSALLVGATTASAEVAPEPVGSTSHVVVVPISPTIQESQGLRWWVVALIALAAALAAAVLTELFDTMRHRRNDSMTLSAA